MHNRRTFLKRTLSASAGLVGIPYLISSRALGQGSVPSASNRIVMGIIGAGSMGTGNAHSFLGMPDVQIVSVCDVDRNHAMNLKRQIDERYGNQDCRVYGDFREMLEKEQLDTVMSATPDHWHAIIAVACAKAGLDIYGEKPLARTIRESREICNAVKQYGRIWQTGSWQRSQWHFRRACELVINGRLGKVTHAEVGLPDGSRGFDNRGVKKVPEHLDWNMWLGPAPWREFEAFGGGGTCHWDWRWIMDYSGGQLTDWAGHHIDIAHWGLGLERTGPVEVEGRGQYPQKGLYDVPYAYDFTCTYASGVKIRVGNQSAIPKGMGVTWYGEKGWIHVDRGDVLQASDPKLLQEEIGPEEIHLYESRNHQRNFIDCVKSRKETITPAEIAHRSISAGLLGELAMLTERKLRWNPETEQFLNDEAAGRLLSRPFRSPWHL